ncbi:MAG: T9SS type A sorting domain-containing protein [Ignavibacteria bacterium]|nr:T9SS type A sorting domain-containing protein [Ignavibacteria bacterium]
MKKLSILSFLIFLSISNAFSQSGWFWQNPLPQGNTIYDILMIDNNNVIAVGDGGTILNSSNLGYNWTNSSHIEDVYMRSICFINNSTGFVSSQGKILRTSNSGHNWTAFSLNYLVTIESIIFVNPQTGFAVGHNGKIFKTTNAGFNWDSSSSGTLEPLLSCCFNDVNTGWVVGWNGTILKTTNSGNVWITIQSSTSNRFTAVFFANNNTGWITSENGNIYKSVNGGLNWTSLSFGSYLGSIHFCDVQTGWAVGSSILKTTDSGNNWIVQPDPSPDDYKTVNFLNTLTGFAAGSLGVIVKTTNGGSNWILLTNKITSNSFEDIYFVDDQKGWAAGLNGSLFNTLNGGSDWSNQFDNSAVNFRSVRFINNNTGWAAGTHVMKTINGGINWNIVAANYSMNKIYPVDNLNLFGLDFNNAIVKSSNGGANWNGVNSGFSGGYYDIFFMNGLTGWAAGSGQKILKTTDGGSTWILQYGGNWPGYMKSIHFCNSLTGLAAGLNPGNSNMLLKTTNGGLNWNVLIFGPQYSFNRVFLLDSNNGFFTTTNYASSDIYFTTNGGISWNLQFSTVSNIISSICFINNSIGWIAGSNGMILKTTSGGTFVGMQISTNQLPQSLSLQQNYPNPFNPVTKIKFDISSAPISFGERLGVKLIIFDLLGREVTTLVNEQLKPGSYEVDWDGTGFASGVYFCSLVTNDFIETKRMVLIK